MHGTELQPSCVFVIYILPHSSIESNTACTARSVLDPEPILYALITYSIREYYCYYHYLLGVVVFFGADVDFGCTKLSLNLFGTFCERFPFLLVAGASDIVTSRIAVQNSRRGDGRCGYRCLRPINMSRTVGEAGVEQS